VHGGLSKPVTVQLLFRSGCDFDKLIITIVNNKHPSCPCPSAKKQLEHYLLLHYTLDPFSFDATDDVTKAMLASRFVHSSSELVENRLAMLIVQISRQQLHG
jgi:hypothetical protein